MPTKVQHDVARDQLHIIFEDRIIARTIWIAENATIDVALDDAPLGITFYFYYTRKNWPITEEMVGEWHLEPYLDDLALVWENFFAPKNFAIKSIHYEAPDGSEVIVKPGQLDA